jgi:hypothetical protein
MNNQRIPNDNVPDNDVLIPAPAPDEDLEVQE